MKILVVSLLVTTLTACGATVESATEDQVSIRYHNYLDSPDSLQPPVHDREPSSPVQATALNSSR